MLDQFPIITLTVFLPLLGVVLLLLMPRHRSGDIKMLATITASLTTLLGMIMFFLYKPDPITGVYINLEEPPFYWIPFLNSSYHVQVDGLNILMVLLTTILAPLIFIASWKSITYRVKEFAIAILLVEMGMLGAFVAQDLLLFFIFWEIMLIPTLFLIGIWGHKDRIPATMRFLLFTLFGSLLMLFAIIYIYAETGSFSIIQLYGHEYLNSDAKYWLFAAFMVAFAIKLPMVPLHGWLPEAYKNAPISANIILAGIMAKVGAYGIIRIAIPMFPHAASESAVFFMVLGVIAIIWGGMMAYAQSDLKQMIAYSSVSHLGFITVGLFSVYLAGGGQSLVYESIQGSIYHMFNHGISIAGLFLLLGFLYARGGTYHWFAYGGLAKVMPRFAAVFMIVMLASIGLPGLNGFVGEILILMGAFKALPVIGILAASGMILSAAYMLLAYQRVFFGSLTFKKLKGYSDINSREMWVMIPLLALMVLGGLLPMVFLNKVDQSITLILDFFTKAFLY